MEYNLRILIEHHRRAEKALMIFRQSKFPIGQCVVVDSEKYKGEGVEDVYVVA